MHFWESTSWSWCILIFICCYIWFASILLKIFASIFITDWSVVLLWFYVFIYFLILVLASKLIWEVFPLLCFRRVCRVGFKCLNFWHESPESHLGLTISFWVVFWLLIQFLYGSVLISCIFLSQFWSVCLLGFCTQFQSVCGVGVPHHTTNNQFSGNISWVSYNSTCYQVQAPSTCCTTGQ